MSRRERPPAVARHRNTALWLPLAALAMFGWFLVTEDLPASRPERADRPDEAAVDGRVLRETAGGAIEVRYVHPVTEQEVTAEVYVWDADLAPEPGRPIRLVADRDDPLSATAAGDVMPWHTNVATYVTMLAATSLPALTHRYGVWRSERLTAALSPGFAMAGVVTPSPRRRFRCDLHLYPLDAAEASPPVCTVPVLTTGRARLGTDVFPVEAKGFPRPLGRVVARAGEAVLWPAGRATRRAVHPRPAGPVRPPAPLPAAEPPEPSRRSPRLITAVAAEAALVGAGLVVLAITVIVTLVHRADAREVEREGRPVVGEVVDHEGTDDVVVLRYEDGGEPAVTRAPADFASDYPKGTRYPARLDPDDPARARLMAERYDAVEPVVWMALPTFGAAGLLWSRWRSWRRGAAVAASGPWWAAHAHAGHRDGELILADDDGGVVCGAFVRRSGLHPRSARVDVVVAGPAEPGAPVAVWRTGGRPLPVVLPATNAGSYSRAWARWRRHGA